MVNVSACLVTRGDVDMTPICDSLDDFVSEVMIWDNAKRDQDLAVYGRYAAIAEAKGDLIFVQDDDVVLPPDSVEEIIWTSDHGGSAYGQLVCNMPQEFRAQDFYAEHALVGFGACFHRDAPRRAFNRIFPDMLNPDPVEGGWWDYSLRLGDVRVEIPSAAFFHRTCDVLFTALTPHVLVDAHYFNLPHADGLKRMWRQPGHVAERQRMLEIALAARDA